MLLKLGFGVEIHPKVGQKRHPDFKVFKEERATEAIEDRIYDTLNRRIHSLDFFIGIDRTLNETDLNLF
ncbi:MAG: hypothetical protein LWW94_08595 [Candidatus Desulfofervidaceae bacterium]|nr:hypothetical protein [Candidatus Desulfofervidaceae bacterium]